MIESETNAAITKAHVLDDATNDMLCTARKRNTRALAAAIICYTLLLIIGILSLYQNDKLATENKMHIDCIVKLLATPQKAGTSHKFITNAANTCNINFN